MPRIRAIAGRYRGPSVDAADLVQEGTVALMEALRRFEPERGVPLWAFAEPWVRGAIHRYAANQRRAVRLPAAALVELTQLRAAFQTLLAAHDSEPRAEAVAAEAGVAPRRAERLLAAGRPPRSLQETAGADGDGAALVDLIADPRGEDGFEEILERVDAPSLPELMHVLSGREREVIERRFGLGCLPERLVEIGRSLGVSRERVRQIEARALDRMNAAA